MPVKPGLSTPSKAAPHWGTAFSAVLIAASLPPWDLGFLVWVALVPWFLAVSKIRNYSGAIAQGFWLGFMVAGLSAWWLTLALHDFLKVSWPTSIAVFGTYAAFSAQPQFLVFAPLLRQFAVAPRGAPVAISLTTPLALALCYAGLDWFLPRVFDVGLGYALHSAENLRQLADVGGVSLLTFLIVWVNLAAFKIIERPGRASTSENNWPAHVGVIVLVLATAFAYGSIRNRELAERLANPTQLVSVGLVQGSVPNDVRLAWASGDDRAAERQLSTYMLLTEGFIKQKPRPDIVLWPEATFPGVFLKPRSKYQQGRGIKFDRQVMRLNRPIVFGAYDLETQGEQHTLFNSLFAIVPDYERSGSQGAVQRYHKHELLPFAETIPGASSIEWLREALPTLGFFGRGEGARVFVLTLADGSEVRAAPIICSESLHPSTVIESAKRNSQMLLNIGSDGWFGNYGEPAFHLAIAKFRSIETRLPQVRAANTGISALILPSGEVTARTEWGEERTLSLEVPLWEPVAPGERTTMLEWGDWFGRHALFIGTALVLILAWAHRRTLS
ncbi:MAG: apolipoprotein N-acyltransferase [Myxococcota bacterium]|nr:apolipoprotein N-acyltransferase [Myxococcota bacterium]